MPKIIFSILLFWSATFLNAQTSSVVIDTLWWDRMGWGGDEVLERMIVANDSTLWAIGSTSSSMSYGQDIYLIHLSDQHECLGTYSFGGNGADLGADMLLLPNGNLLLLGTTSSFSAIGYDWLVYEVNPNGEVVASNIFEEEGWQFAQRFHLTGESQLMVTGKELNALGQWDLKLWNLDMTAGLNESSALSNQWPLELNAQDIAASFITRDETTQQWWGFVSYWNADSIPNCRAFEINPQMESNWSSGLLENTDSILMYDAIVKDNALIMVGGFYHNNQFRPQLMKLQPGIGMWSISNYPDYQRETMFHGVGYTQDSLVYCAVGWSFEFGFGMGGGFYNYFDQNDQWMGNGFIGGDLLCKMNDVVFDLDNHLHSIGLDNSHTQGMSQQAWLVRGNGCLFVQPNTVQIENATVSCFQVGMKEEMDSDFQFVSNHHRVSWNGTATWLGAYDVYGRKISTVIEGQNAVRLNSSSQCVLLKWLVNGEAITRKVFVLE